MWEIVVVVLIAIIVKNKRENRRLLKAQEEMAKQVSEEIWTLANDIVFLCDRGGTIRKQLKQFVEKCAYRGYAQKQRFAYILTIVETPERVYWDMVIFPTDDTMA